MQANEQEAAAKCRCQRPIQRTFLGPLIREAIAEQRTGVIAEHEDGHQLSIGSYHLGRVVTYTLVCRLPDGKRITHAADSLLRLVARASAWGCDILEDFWWEVNPQAEARRLEARRLIR